MFNTRNSKHILAIDAIPFLGGSKVATNSILSQFANTDISVSVLSSDPKSWKSDNIRVIEFREFPFLAKRETGPLYYLKHLFISIHLFVNWLKLGKNTLLMGTSGPGVDFSIYLVNILTGAPIIQLFHGPVARSRSIGNAILRSDIIIYLPSTLTFIRKALGSVINEREIDSTLGKKSIKPMLNGISQQAWPSGSKNNFKKLHICWAASLLKWKGLDTLSEALYMFDSKATPKTTICYIKPKSTSIEMSELPTNLNNTSYFEQPSNIDELRSQSNVFVSTSHNEPFGLSILEAMIAGLCIVIPRDGAYWDSILQEDVHCIKYIPGSSKDLYKRLVYLQNNMDVAKRISIESKKIGDQYQAETTYLPIVKAINNALNPATACSVSAY